MRPMTGDEKGRVAYMRPLQTNFSSLAFSTTPRNEGLLIDGGGFAEGEKDLNMQFLARFHQWRTSHPPDFV